MAISTRLRIVLLGLISVALSACSASTPASPPAAATAGSGAAAVATSAAPAAKAAATAAPTVVAAAPTVAAAAATAGTGALAALAATDVGVTADQIQLGGTIALSGPAAAYGTIARSADAYFRYVNDNGGVLGRKIVYTYLDDAYNPAQTVPLTKQQVEQDNVFLMFGGLGTQAQTSVRDYLNSKKVPQVFVATGATTFAAEFQKYPYTFGWQPVYQGEALIYAQYLLQNTPKAKIGVIYQNDDYGQDYLDGLTKGLGTRASDMIVDKETNDVGAPDLSSQILKLKNSGADTLFVFETPSPAIKALVATAQAGWQPTIFLNAVSNPVPYVQAAQKTAGDPSAVNGIITVAYLKDSLDPAQASDPGIQLFKQIMTRYYPEGKIEDNFNVYGMGTAFTLVDVLKKVGPNLTRAAVLDALGHLDETDNPFVYAGISVRNTPTDHYTITTEYLAKYDAATGVYTRLGDPIDVRGKITFP